MTLDVLSFMLGGLLVAIGILGGGLEIKEMKVPRLGNTTRILAVIGGLGFIILGLTIPGPGGGPDSSGRKIFYTPKLGEYQLDYCYTWGNNCGLPSASAWCRVQGYTDAVEYLEDTDIGNRGIVTKIIGTGDLCKEWFCDSFASITCRK